MDRSTGRPFGWALIGCGNVGNSHSQWAAAAQDIDVRAFCDINAEAASRYYEQYEGGYHTTDPARIFADADVEIVTIATSHGTHAELAIAAFEAGKHVYLEKPMAMTTADCLRIYEAMQAANRKLMINFSIRFSGATRAIKSRLQPPKASHAQCMLTRADLTRWQWDPVIGGGPLFDVGVHPGRYAVLDARFAAGGGLGDRRAGDPWRRVGFARLGRYGGGVDPLREWFGGDLPDERRRFQRGADQVVLRVLRW